MTSVYEETAHGLLGWYGQPWEIAQLHRHNDIELNLVTQGRLHYLLAGEEQVIATHQLLVFWAVMPHRILYCHPETRLVVIHLPLLEFLRWNLPTGLVERLLLTQPLLDTDPDPDFDQKLFCRWAAALQQNPTPSVHPEPLEQHQIVLLELEARLRRMAGNVSTITATSPSKHPSHVAQIAQIIAKHHSENILLGDLCKQLHLHPNYAAQLFKHTLGLTMSQYLVQQRLAHAQRLLLTSHDSILEIALTVGFGSLSRFYQAFVEHTGYTPKRYRNAYARLKN